MVEGVSGSGLERRYKGGELEMAPGPSNIDTVSVVRDVTGVLALDHGNT